MSVYFNISYKPTIMTSGMKSVSQKSQRNRVLSDLDINKEKFNVFRLSTSIHEPNELTLHIQTRTGLISVPKPTFKYDIDTILIAKKEDQQHVIEECEHNFTVIKEQVRSKDEGFSVFYVCIKCNYTKRHD